MTYIIKRIYKVESIGCFKTKRGWERRSCTTDYTDLNVVYGDLFPEGDDWYEMVEEHP